MFIIDSIKVKIYSKNKSRSRFPPPDKIWSLEIELLLRAQLVNSPRSHFQSIVSFSGSRTNLCMDCWCAVLVVRGHLFPSTTIGKDLVIKLDRSHKSSVKVNLPSFCKHYQFTYTVARKTRWNALEIMYKVYHFCNVSDMLQHNALPKIKTM